MARGNIFKLFRGTRANLNALASSNGLLQSEPIYISDENRLAVGTAVNGFAGMAKQSELLRTIGITVSSSTTLTTGLKGMIVASFSGTILGWDIISTSSGSVVFDVWKSTTVPTVSDTIVASAPPTLSSAQLARSTAISTWTQAVAVGDVLAFNINSVSLLTSVTLTLRYLQS